MFEVFAEFDLLWYGFAEAHYQGKDYEDCKAQVVQALETCDGGHADMFNADGEFIDDVEV